MMFDSIKDRTAPFVDTAADRTRNATVMLADAVARTHRPVDIAVQTSLKLNEITHNSVARFVKQQADMIGGTVDAASKRLHVAADADTLRDLVNDQIAMFPATRERLSADARNTVEVFTDARDEVAELLRDLMAKARGVESEVEKTVRTAKRTATSAKRKATKKVQAVKKSAKKASSQVTKKARTATRKKSAARKS